MRNVIQLCLVANNILLMCKWNHAFFPLAITLVWKWLIVLLPEDFHLKQTWWTIDKTIIKLSYHKIWWFDLSVSPRSIICLSLQLWQINNNIELPATEKSWYFAQPRPIIVNYFDIKMCFIINMLPYMHY